MVLTTSQAQTNVMTLILVIFITKGLRLTQHKQNNAAGHESNKMAVVLFCLGQGRGQGHGVVAAAHRRVSIEDEGPDPGQGHIQGTERKPTIYE